MALFYTSAERCELHPAEESLPRVIIRSVTATPTLALEVYSTLTLSLVGLKYHTLFLRAYFILRVKYI